MNLIRLTIFILISALLFSCKKDAIEPSECADCVEYQFQQIVNDITIDVLMVNGTYCLGDTAFYNLSDNLEFSIIISDTLLNSLHQNGYCQFSYD